MLSERSINKEGDVTYTNLRYTTKLKHLMKIYKEDFKIKASDAKKIDVWVEEVKGLSEKMDASIDNLNSKIADENIELFNENLRQVNEIEKLKEEIATLKGE